MIEYVHVQVYYHNVGRTIQHMQTEGAGLVTTIMLIAFLLCKRKLLRLSGSTCEVLVDKCCETIASWLKTPWCTLTALACSFLLVYTIQGSLHIACGT